MYEKERNIISLLIDQNDYITNKEIQETLNISRRSIINYIKNINSSYDNLISSSKKGYIIDKKLASTILEKENSLSFEGYENRKIYLLQKLILDIDTMNIDDIANELCISTYTFKKDINRLQTELKIHNLYIKTKNNNIYLIGKEQDKKKYITKLLSKELENHSFNIDFFQNIFTFANIKKIQSIIAYCINKHNFFIDDFSLLNYALHLAICIETSKISVQEINDTNNISYKLFNTKTKNIIQDIYNELENTFKISLSFNQICESSLLMSTRIISKDSNQLSFDQLYPLLGDEVISLVNHIVNSVHNIYGINLKNDNFLVRFSFHIKNLLIRLQNHISIPTNQFITIKEDYPFLYYIANYIGSIISYNTKNILSENEISYIALHLGVLMEEKKTYHQKINCVIVLYDYYNIGKLLFQQINNCVKELYLLNIVSSYDQIDNGNNNIDLIISTLPLNSTYDIPMVHVHMIPSQNDIKKINSMISNIKDIKKTKAIINNIKTFFKKDLFYNQTNYTSREEVINHICDYMIKKEYVKTEFKQAIFDREKIASSAYQNIAIPHPINIDNDLINESAISVIINKNSITWGENKVNCIFLLALKEEDRQYFKDLFDIIINLIIVENSHPFSTIKEYDQFIQIIVENYKKSL